MEKKEKIWVGFAAVVVAIAVVGVFLWCPCFWLNWTTIEIVDCTGAPGVTAEETQYEVKKGGVVEFDNKSTVPVTITLLGCDIFEGDPGVIELGVGERAVFSVKPDAAGDASDPCRTLIDPACGLGGPELIPWP